MLLRIDRLQTELPAPKKADPNAAAELQELLGGKYGEMPTLGNYLFQSFNFRSKSLVCYHPPVCRSLHLWHFQLPRNGFFQQVCTLSLLWKTRFRHCASIRAFKSDQGTTWNGKWAVSVKSWKGSRRTSHRPPFVLNTAIHYGDRPFESFLKNAIGVRQGQTMPQRTLTSLTLFSSSALLPFSS